VASDDDYYNIPDTPADEVKGNSTLPRLKSSSGALAAVTNTSLQSSPAKSNSSGNSTSLYSSTAASGKRLGNESSAAGPLTTISHSSEYYALKQQLENSEFRVQALIDSNGDMRHEISRLSVMVNKLVNENHNLRSNSHESMDFMPVENEYATPQTLATHFVKPPPPVRSTTTSVTTTTATNLFEPQRPRPPTSSVGTGGSGPTSLPVYVAATASAAASAVNNARHSTPYQAGGSYLIEDEASHGSASLPVSGHDFFNSTASSTSGSATCLPSQEEVVRRTEAITRCIQELVIISHP
jgi:hypothetical protein